MPCPPWCPAFLDLLVLACQAQHESSASSARDERRFDPPLTVKLFGKPLPWGRRSGHSHAVNF